MTDQSPMSTTRTVPLDALSLHPFNPRQAHDADDIAALAKSISINGLMQNLNALDEDGELGVVAGGRRLRALQHLRAQGSAFADSADIDFDAIPVNVTTDPALARSWAGSEGATQRPLHPADEIRAYAAMAEHGSAPDQIAAAFGQTTAHVTRRLKLAQLTAATLDALRLGSITLDVAKVLTLTGDSAREADALALATEHNWNAEQLRRRLFDGAVPSNDRRVRFIGLDLYRAEGGAMEEDLFSDQSVLHDEELVDRLFMLKLEKAAEDVREGRGVARAVPLRLNYDVYKHSDKMRRIYRTPIELPEADQQRLQELEDAADNRELDQAEQETLAELEERQRGDYDADELAAATVFVMADHHGDLQVDGPWLPRDTGSGNGEASEGSAGPVAAKPAVTQGGIDDLHRIERLALQARMLSQPELALDLLAFQLWTEMPSFAAPFNLRAEDQLTLPSSVDGVTIDKRVTGEEDEQAADPREDFDAAFDAFTAKGKKHRNQVLTTLLARTLNAPASSDATRHLAHRLKAEPRQIWTPTAASFFNAVRSEALDAIWRELVVTEDRAEQMERFAKLKVGEKRKELEALFNDASVQEALSLSRAEVAAIDKWLPAELRRDAQ